MRGIGGVLIHRGIHVVQLKRWVAGHADSDTFSTPQ